MIDWNKAKFITWLPKLGFIYSCVGLAGFWTVYLTLSQ